MRVDFMLYLADMSKKHAPKAWRVLPVLLSAGLGASLGGLLGVLYSLHVAWWAIALFGAASIGLCASATFYTILPGPVIKARNAMALDWHESTQWPRLLAVDVLWGQAFISILAIALYAVIVWLSGAVWYMWLWTLVVAYACAIIFFNVYPITRWSALFLVGPPFNNEALYHCMLTHIAEIVDGGDDTVEKLTSA